jgi:hypothetical protein
MMPDLVLFRNIFKAVALFAQALFYLQGSARPEGADLCFA